MRSQIPNNVPTIARLFVCLQTAVPITGQIYLVTGYKIHQSSIANIISLNEKLLVFNSAQDRL